MEHTINDDNFEKEVMQEEMPVLVDFWADWCPPCKMMEPIVADIAEEYEGKLKVGNLNVDDNPNTASRFKIRGIPTLVLFKKGIVVEQIIGAQNKESLKQKLDLLIT